MREMLKLEHMIEAKELPKTEQMVYYIPHHAVTTSGEFKVVFDASCRTKLGISLNQAQLIGAKKKRGYKKNVSADSYCAKTTEFATDFLA